MQQKNQSIFRISSKYPIIGEDATNLDAIQRWCDEKKLSPSNGNPFPQAQYDALVRGNTINGYVCAEIVQLLVSVGMQDRAKAFEVKAPELFIFPAYIEPLNGNDVKNAENSQVQECNTEKEQQRLERATWEVWARTTPLTQESINAIRSQRHKDECAHDVVEKEIKEIYTLRVEYLKNNLKAEQQKLEQAKNQRIINKDKTRDNRQKASDISRAQLACTDFQQKLRDERATTPEGIIENAKEDLERLQEQNTTLARTFFGLGRILNKRAVENNRLKIANLEDQIYGTEIISREKREIAQQKNWKNVGANNSTRNNTTKQR